MSAVTEHGAVFHVSVDVRNHCSFSWRIFLANVETFVVNGGNHYVLRGGGNVRREGHISMLPGGLLLWISLPSILLFQQLSKIRLPHEASVQVPYYSILLSSISSSKPPQKPHLAIPFPQVTPQITPQSIY